MEELRIETTVYSMSDDPPAEPDRRSDERHLTLFRVGAILIGDRRELCLVKNISAGGALIRAYSALEADQRVLVELKEGQPVAGQVSWVQGSDAGIVFDTRVSIIDVLKTASDGPRPRMPRIELSCVAYVRQGAQVHRVTLHNISQGGLNARTAASLTVGSEVTVTLPGLPPQPALVRWNEGDRYGITFNSVLPLAVLVQWLQERSAQ